MKQLYATRRIQGQKFILSEHLGSFQGAKVAQAEYWCEGLYCRVEPVEEESLYYVWTAPGRNLIPRTLSGEDVKRRKGLRIIREVG